MYQQRVAGGLWFAAGVSCAGLFTLFIGENANDLGALVRDPLLPALVLAGAVASLVLGARLATRPSGGTVRMSTALGAVWLLAFGSIVVTAIGDTGEPGPLVSSSLITALGVAGAIVALLVHRRAGSNSPQASPIR